MNYVLEVIGPEGLERLPVLAVELGVGEHGVRLEAVLARRGTETLDFADADCPVDDLVVVAVVEA